MLVSLIALVAWQPDTALLAPLFEEALARKRREYGIADIRTAPAARDLGLFLSKHGATAAAQKVFTDLVRLEESALGATNPQTLSDLAALANVSPPRQAEPLWRRASASPDPNVSARAFAALGQLRETAGDHPGAAAFYRQALAKEEMALSASTAPLDKAHHAIRIGGIAQVLSPLVEPAEGITVLRKSMALNRSVLGASHPETATVQANLAGVLLDANMVDESVRLVNEAIAMLEESLGRDHPRVAISATILAYGLRTKGDFVRAEQNYRRAVAIDERIYGPRHPQTLNDVRVLAEFLRERGKLPEAATLEKRLASGAK